VVAAKKAKPAPSDVISAPSPPKMILNALSTSLKKSPSSAGKSVVFALDKNTTHTFKRDQPEKRRFSWF
jgi:hypothetical protein